MIKFEITFVWPNGEWTWINVEALDFQDAMGIAISRLPISCRIKSIVKVKAKEV
jgi:hypothetical protein